MVAALDPKPGQTILELAAGRHHYAVQRARFWVWPNIAPSARAMVLWTSLESNVGFWHIGDIQSATAMSGVEG